MNTNTKIIITVIVVALLGVVGYFLLNKNKSLYPSSVTPTTAMVKPTVEPTAPETSPSPEATGGAMMKEDTMIVTLNAQNKSGENGTATLKDVNGKTVVTVNITGAPATAQPEHIHLGSCAKLGDVKYALSPLVNGKSETTLSVSLATIKKGLPLAINVHKSAVDIATYVACGDLK